MKVMIKETRGVVVGYIEFTSTPEYVAEVQAGKHSFQVWPSGRLYWWNGRVSDEVGKKTNYKCEITVE